MQSRELSVCRVRRKHWLLVREKSTFVDWQRVKVQELSEEVRPSAEIVLNTKGVWFWYLLLTVVGTPSRKYIVRCESHEGQR